MAHTDTVQGLEDTPIRVVAEQERKGRNRPGTASGIVFVTMEDETGPINVILRPELVEKQRRETLAARLLGVYGQLESRHGVTPSGGQAAGGYDTATGTAGDAESGFSLGQYRSGADLGWCAA